MVYPPTRPGYTEADIDAGLLEARRTPQSARPDWNGLLPASSYDKQCKPVKMGQVIGKVGNFEGVRRGTTAHLHSRYSPVHRLETDTKTLALQASHARRIPLPDAAGRTTDLPKAAA